MRLKLITLVLLIFLALLQYRLWLGHGNLFDVKQLEQARVEKIAENKNLRERNQALAAEVVDLKQGLGAIEELARSQMGMIKKGETFYQIVSADKLPSPPNVKNK